MWHIHIEHRAAAAAADMVMLLGIEIKAVRPVWNRNTADLSLIGQLVQIAVYCGYYE